MNVTIVISSGWGIRIFLQSGVIAELAKTTNVSLIISEGLTDGILNSNSRQSLSYANLKPFNIETGLYTRAYKKRDYLFSKISPTFTRRAKARRHFQSLTCIKKMKLIANNISYSFMPSGINNYNALINVEQSAFSKEYPELERYYAELFKKWKTDLVVATAPHIIDEIPPILAAKNIGIRTAAWVNSWDNLTSKPAYRAAFDSYLLWSEHLAQQLQKYYPESLGKQIYSTGAPHFDWYKSNDFIITREQFCIKNGIDLNARIILYAACTPHLYPNENILVTALLQDLTRLFPGNKVQMIVRLHPGDSGSRFSQLIDHPDIKLHIPNRTGALESFFPTLEENMRLVNSIKHADVIINTASTITIDAAIANIPCVNVAFDIARSNNTQKEIRNYYKYDHFKTVVDLKASKVAYSYSELINSIHAYLENPNTELEGRAALVSLWCGKIDGSSHKRLAEAIVQSITSDNSSARTEA